MQQNEINQEVPAVEAKSAFVAPKLERFDTLPEITAGDTNPTGSYTDIGGSW